MNMLNVAAEKFDDRNISIHPGVIGGVRVHPLKRTSKPNKRTGKVLKAVTDRFDRRMAGWEQTKKTVDAKQQNAFRKPGSRNPGKLRNR